MGQVLNARRPGATLTSEAPSSPQRPAGLHPWRRCFARAFDVWLFPMCATWAVVRLLSSGADSAGMGDRDGMIGVAVLAVLAAYVPVESMLLTIFGTTPGKVLYGVSLAPKVGRTTFRDAARRSALVWIKGLGFGEPIIAIFTMAHAYAKLRDLRSTSWDLDLGWQARHARLGPARWVGIAAAWAAILALATVVVAYGA